MTEFPPPPPPFDPSVQPASGGGPLPPPPMAPTQEHPTMGTAQVTGQSSGRAGVAAAAAGVPPGAVYGQSSGSGPVGAYASWIQRVAAYLADSLLVAIILAVLGAIAGLIGTASALGGQPFGAGLAAAWIASPVVLMVYAIVSNASATGQTVGRRMLGIHVERDVTGAKLGGWLAIGRWFATILSIIPLDLGYLAPLWTQKRQTFHDIVVGSVVVPDRPGRPVGAKAGLVAMLATAVVAIVVLMAIFANSGSWITIGSNESGYSDVDSSYSSDGTGYDDTTQDTASENTETTSNTVGDAQALVVASVSAGDSLPPAETKCEPSPLTYGGDQMVDGDVNTAWGTKGDGAGRTIVFQLSEPVEIESVALTPGYAKVGPVNDEGCPILDRFPKNRQIRAATWTVGDVTKSVTFAGDPGLQSSEIGAVADRVTLTIDRTERPPGADDFTFISEVTIMGRPASSASSGSASTSPPTAAPTTQAPTSAAPTTAPPKPCNPTNMASTGTLVAQYSDAEFETTICQSGGVYTYYGYSLTGGDGVTLPASRTSFGFSATNQGQSETYRYDIYDDGSSASVKVYKDGALYREGAYTKVVRG